MSAIGNLYEHLIEALFETVDGIAFVDIDLGQLKKEGENIPVEYPGLIIRFENIFWKEYDASKQIGVVHVRLKFIYPYTNEAEFYEPSAGIRTEVVAFFEIIQNIHTAVSSIAMSNHTQLFRFNENHLDNKPEEMKWVYCLDYYCNIYSDASDFADGSTLDIDYTMLERGTMVFDRTIDAKKVG